MSVRIGDRLWTAAWAVLLAATLAVAAVVSLFFWAKEALGRGPESPSRADREEDEEDFLDARSPTGGAAHEV